MNFPFLLLLAWVFTTQCSFQTQSNQNMRKITKNGMTVNWQIEGERLRLTMSAPTRGWVAIGFNDREGLAGTNLIMGCVKEGKAEVSDRYIVASGDHRSIVGMGGTAATQLVSGRETGDSTTLEFTLPLRAPDRWHHDLKTGKIYYLLMAFSRDDDFAHHSMMRTSETISL